MFLLRDSTSAATVPNSTSGGGNGKSSSIVLHGRIVLGGAFGGIAFVVVGVVLGASDRSRARSSFSFSHVGP